MPAIVTISTYVSSAKICINDSILQVKCMLISEMHATSILIQIFTLVTQRAVLNGFLFVFVFVLFCSQTLHNKRYISQQLSSWKRASDFIEISSKTSHSFFILRLQWSKERLLNNLNFGLFNYLNWEKCHMSKFINNTSKKSYGDNPW